MNDFLHSVPPKKLTKEMIENLLEQTNEKLAKLNKFGKILITGGAAMTMVFEARESTYDIDGVFSPEEDMNKIIKEISDENNIQIDWLNEAVEDFLTPQMKYNTYKEYGNLTINCLDPECILAMKLTAARAENDASDTLFLMKLLKIKNIEQLYGLIKKYTAREFISEKCMYFTQAIFELYSEQEQER